MDQRAAESRLRLLTFSDGVFAIALTLLVIELHPPHDWDQTVAGLWNGMWRSFSAYVVSFAVTAAFWNGHRRLFLDIHKVDGWLIALNIVLLGLVVLIPFVTELLYVRGPRGDALLIYLGLFALTGAAQGLLWGYAALVGNLCDPGVPMAARIGRTLFLVFVPGTLAGLWFAASSANDLLYAGGMLLLTGAIIAVRRLFFGDRAPEAVVQAPPAKAE